MQVKMLLLLGATMTASLGAQSNNNSALKPGHFDLAVTYNPTVANVVTGSEFSMQGGSVQVQGQIWRGLGVVADVSGLHSGDMQSSGVGLDMITATFGPRYTWQPARRRYAIYAQFLAGEVNGLHSIFPSAQGASDSAESMAWLAGGRMNIPLRRRLALRAFEANWLRTQLPNATTNEQNNLCLGAGIVIRFE